MPPEPNSKKRSWTVWQRLNISVALIVLHVVLVMLGGLWIQRFQSQCAHRGEQILAAQIRIENSLFRYRAAARDVLSGGELALAREERDSAHAFFEREIDRIRDGYADYPEMVEASLKLRDLVTGPMNALFLRYMGTGATAAELVAYDKDHYPSIKAEKARLLANLRTAAEAVRTSEQERGEFAGKVAWVCALLLLAGLIFAVRAHSRALADARAAESRLAAQRDLLKETQLLARQGREQAGHLRSTVKPVFASVRQFADAVDAMRDKLSRIHSAAGVLGKIADQGNLLSLNAAIEAERAGEYGLGFAVVAMEIRRLSDQTTEAHREVEQVLKEVSATASRGLEGGASTEIPEVCEAEVAKINAGFENIFGNIEELLAKMGDYEQKS